MEESLSGPWDRELRDTDFRRRIKAHPVSSRLEARFLTFPNSKIVRVALVSLGILVLALDVWADLSFFSSGPHPGLALQAAAVVRNLLTAVAVACLFVDKKVSAYALLLAAILGMWRRLVYLAPLLAQGPGDSTVTATAGLDFGFRMLILGIALGWLFSKGQREGS